MIRKGTSIQLTSYIWICILLIHHDEVIYHNKQLEASPHLNHEILETLLFDRQVNFVFVFYRMDHDEMSWHYEHLNLQSQVSDRCFMAKAAEIAL